MIATRKQLPRLGIAGVRGMTHTKLVTPGGASVGSVKNVRNIRSRGRHSKARETECTLLLKRTPMVLEIDRRDLPNRVNRDEVCPPALLFQADEVIR
jgi:hypothetical protein